jgi:hypothetical protein
VVEWLYSIKPDIDISAENEYAFRLACDYNRLDVVRWLHRFKPSEYSYLNNDGKIIRWPPPPHALHAITYKSVNEIVICRHKLKYYKIA